MTTLPDTNVRPARRAAAASARAARNSVVARLLLALLHYLSKLDRKLLLLLFASPMSACIIPAGPEFQDPEGVPDSPPFLISVSPDQGSTVVTGDPEFTVTPSDVNVGDDLYVMWLTEYPPLTEQSNVGTSSTIYHSEDGSPLAEPRSFRPNCYQVNRRISTHQIMAVISDSPFVSNKLLFTENGIRPLQVNWTWVKNCAP